MYDKEGNQEQNHSSFFGEKERKKKKDRWKKIIKSEERN